MLCPCSAVSSSREVHFAWSVFDADHATFDLGQRLLTNNDRLTVAGVAQLAEQWLCKIQAPGSSPGVGTITPSAACPSRRAGALLPSLRTGMRAPALLPPRKFARPGFTEAGVTVRENTPS